MTKLKKMTKHWKEIGVMFAFTCMLFFAQSITASAYSTANGNPNDSSATAILSGYCGDHAEYVLYSNGDLFITGYGDMFDFTKRNDTEDVPYGYTPWGKYLRSLYYDDDSNAYPNAIHVYIDADITSVGNYAFYAVEKLGSVTFERGTKCDLIGKYAFRGNPNMTSFYIPSKVTKINAFAFYGTGLTSITIPNATTYIGDSAFAHTKLKSITIPKSVKYLGSSVFDSCNSLISANLSKSQIAILATGTFEDCTALKSISLPVKLKTISSDTFRNCRSLTSIIIPSNVTKIQKAAFYNTKNLKTMTIQSKKVTSVETNAIKNSNSKLVIKVPDSKYSVYKKLFTSKTGYKSTMKIKKS